MRGRDRQGTPYGSFGDRRAQDPAGLPRTSLALGASPALAGGLDLSVHCGVDEYDAVELKSGLCGVNGSSHPKDFSTYVGATAIIWRGVAELGAIGELGRPGKNGTTSLLGALGGLGFDAGSFRLEALGELGAHRYGDLLNGSYVMERSKSEAWLVSAGLRPGLSVRFGPPRYAPGGGVGFRALGRHPRECARDLGQLQQVHLRAGWLAVRRLGPDGPEPIAAVQRAGSGAALKSSSHREIAWVSA